MKLQLVSSRVAGCMAAVIINFEEGLLSFGEAIGVLGVAFVGAKMTVRVAADLEYRCRHFGVVKGSLLYAKQCR